MSSFIYGNHTKKHIGVWLRFQGSNDLIKMIEKSKQKRFFDSIMRVVVSEYDKETNQVWLEIWCKNIIDSIRGKTRYSVFYIKTNINPQWVCEGDLGNGINFFNK